MSEELVPLRKSAKKALGRGLGSLLGEIAAANEAQLKVALNQVADQKKIEESSQPSGPLNSAAGPVAARPLEKEIATPAADDQKIWHIGIEKLSSNREQPRKVFEQDKLAELAASVKEKGIILPIVVKKIGADQYEIIAGERRWRAAQLAGKKEVPVIIRRVEKSEGLEMALIENIQRHDLNVMEEAEAYHLLATKYQLTQNLIADKVGKERSTVANLMRLSALAADVKILVKSGELQLGQAKVLLAVEDKVLQTKLAKKVVQLRLSVRATERLVAKAKDKDAVDLEIENTPDEEREIRSIIAELQKLTGTKVDMSVSGQRSKVAFHFYSTAELNQFIDKLRDATL